LDKRFFFVKTPPIANNFLFKTFAFFLGPGDVLDGISKGMSRTDGLRTKI